MHAEQDGPGRGFESDGQGQYLILADAPEVASRVATTLEDRDPNRPLFPFVPDSDPHDPHDSHEVEAENAAVRLDGKPFPDLSLSEAGFLEGAAELTDGVHELSLASDHGRGWGRGVGWATSSTWPTPCSECR